MGVARDLFKKIRCQGNISFRDGHSKWQKWYGLNRSTRVARIYSELYKKDLNDPDNHNGVITHLEPDILQCKSKWALGNITTSKVTGGDGIQSELLQVLKVDTVKVLFSICQKIWNTYSGHRTRKGKFSFQSQRSTMPKNVQAIAQLYSFHMLGK